MMWMTMQTKLIALAIALALIVGVVTKAYFNGREEGERRATAVFDKERLVLLEEKLVWQNKVASSQQQYYEVVTNIAADFKAKSDSYQAEIDKLLQNPKVVIKYVPRDTQCAVPNGFVDLHNLAADGKVLEDTPPTPGISDKSLTDVATVVADNYYACNRTRDRLEALQKLVRQFQKRQEELMK